MTKKAYTSPAIESQVVDLPEAWACTVNLAGHEAGGGVYCFEGTLSTLCQTYGTCGC